MAHCPKEGPPCGKVSDTELFANLIKLIQDLYLSSPGLLDRGRDIEYFPYFVFIKLFVKFDPVQSLCSKYHDLNIIFFFIPHDLKTLIKVTQIVPVGDKGCRIYLLILQ